MELLRNFFHLHLAGTRASVGRPVARPRDFNVTVPAPLAVPTTASSVVDLPRPEMRRREPASFLRSPRHLRLGGGRR